MRRTFLPFLDQILQKWQKMAFVSGPRQVGKTTLAMQYAKEWGTHLYFNWDSVLDQKKLAHNPYFFTETNREAQRPLLVILDEIHKYSRWKNYLKGAFDKYHEDFRFIVTGSGRLDFFKKGGDSLLGRYFSLPLFPVTLSEAQNHFPTFKEFKNFLSEPPQKKDSSAEIYRNLFQYSGFPEPFLKGETQFYNAWFQERKSLLIREDIRDASRIREISQLEILSHLLPERIGKPLSINSLKEDVGVAFETIRDWIGLLNAFYYLFRINPFSGSLKRALKKEPKIYLYDWVEVPQEGDRFENLVALHLLKAVKTWNATGEAVLDLCYLRDKEKREVDFALVEKKKPVLLVECKQSQKELDPSLLFFQQKLKVPVVVQLIHDSGIFQKRRENGFIQWIVSADHWLQILP